MSLLFQIAVVPLGLIRKFDTSTPSFTYSEADAFFCIGLDHESVDFSVSWLGLSTGIDHPINGRAASS